MKASRSAEKDKRRNGLVQTMIARSVRCKLDALATATGHTRASYLRHLIEMHVRSVDPKLARALENPSPEFKW